MVREGFRDKLVADSTAARLRRRWVERGELSNPEDGSDSLSQGQRVLPGLASPVTGRRSA